MVLLAHLPFSRAALSTAVTADVFPPEAISHVLAKGEYGVQLFLVISGYCIHARWARNVDISARVEFMGFWRRRLTRLYPPYVLALAASAAVMLAAVWFFPAALPAVSPGTLAMD